MDIMTIDQVGEAAAKMRIDEIVHSLLTRNRDRFKCQCYAERFLGEKKR